MLDNLVRYKRLPKMPWPFAFPGVLCFDLSKFTITSTSSCPAMVLLYHASNWSYMADECDDPAPAVTRNKWTDPISMSGCNR